MSIDRFGVKYLVKIISQKFLLKRNKFFVFVFSFLFLLFKTYKNNDKERNDFIIIKRPSSILTGLQLVEDYFPIEA